MPPNPAKIVNTVHYIQPRGYYTNWAYANMATSYALKLYLQNNEYAEARPIMKWLQTQHNQMLAWSSTQDTLMVLEALTEFALLDANFGLYQMEVSLEATNNPDWKHTVMFNFSNFASLREFELPNAWGQIKASARGTGYAYLHLMVEWNVDADKFVDSPHYKALSLEVVNIYYSGWNGSMLEMDVCISWKRPDIAPEAGLSWMKINIPTGYMVTRDHIDAVYNQDVPGLMWVDFADNTLSFLFSHVPQQKVCWNLQADRWWPVANVSTSHKVHVAEYSESGLFQDSLYKTYTLSYNDICQVCGASQCQNCPDRYREQTRSTKAHEPSKPTIKPTVGGATLKSQPSFTVFIAFIWVCWWCGSAMKQVQSWLEQCRINTM